MFSLGENMFIWFCYCGKLKVWYYKPGFGTTKTMKIEVSVNRQDTFLVVTELSSQQLRCLNIKEIKSLRFSGKQQFSKPHFYFSCLFYGHVFLSWTCFFLFLIYPSVCTALLWTLTFFLFQNGQTIRLEPQFSMAWNGLV